MATMKMHKLNFWILVPELSAKKAADEELMNFDDDDGNGWDDEDADWGDLEDGKYLTNSVQQLF